MIPLQEAEKGGCRKESEGDIKMGLCRKTGEPKACGKDEARKQTCPGTVETLSHKEGK